jgi:chromosome segregation ATPase
MAEMDFMAQVESTWKQIKAKTEALEHAQAENARLSGVADSSKRELEASLAREQETRGKMLALTAAVKDRDKLAGTLKASVEQLQAAKAAAEGHAMELQMQLAELVERYKHGEGVNIALNERLHNLEHGPEGLDAVRSRLGQQVEELTAQLRDEKQRTEAAKKEVADRTASLDREKAELNKCVVVAAVRDCVRRVVPPPGGRGVTLSGGRRCAGT